MPQDSYFWPMKRNDKPRKTIENIEIIDISTEGAGVGKFEGKVYFIQGAVPGDVVNAEISKSKKDWAEGRLTQLNTPSKERISAECQHFGLCGGCKWQHLNYSAQLRYKQKFVKDAFERIGKINPVNFHQIIQSNSIFHYRNKLEFSFSSFRWLTTEDINGGVANRNGLGFHIPGRFDKIFHVNECLLMPDFCNEIRNFVHEKAQELDISYFDPKFQTGNLRSLTIRWSSRNEWMVLLSAFDVNEKVEVLLNEIKSKFQEINSLLAVQNQKRNETIQDLEIQTFYGRSYIEEEMDGLVFKISAKSFFQTNSKQAKELYKTAIDFSAIKNSDVVYDLYTGTGTIANYVARNARFVVGIEYVDDAVKYAYENSRINSLSNTTFISGDMKNVLNDELFSKYGKPDVIITDPPRAGMHEDVVRTLLKIEAPLITYISCNPATQARDCAILGEKYSVEHVQPVDMFPHTTHVESIAILKLK